MKRMTNVKIIKKEEITMGILKKFPINDASDESN